MDIDEIRILLIQRKIRTVKNLARRIQKTRQHTSAVLHGHVKSKPTRRAIADALGVPVAELWPNDKRAA